MNERPQLLKTKQILPDISMHKLGNNFPILIITPLSPLSLLSLSPLLSLLSLSSLSLSLSFILSLLQPFGSSAQNRFRHRVAASNPLMLIMGPLSDSLISRLGRERGERERQREREEGPTFLEIKEQNPLITDTFVQGLFVRFIGIFGKK